jgi:hypothetical protein
VAVAIMVGGIVIPTISIAAAPMLASILAALRFIAAVLRFIVAEQSQEVALLLEAGARMSPTAAGALAVGRSPNKGTACQAPAR